MTSTGESSSFPDHDHVDAGGHRPTPKGNPGLVRVREAGRQRHPYSGSESVEVTMNGTGVRVGNVSNDATKGGVAMNLEVIVISVADVERAKEFYGRLGWRLDADVAPGGDIRLVQYTPPGSACSVQFGTDLTPSPPGS